MKKEYDIEEYSYADALKRVLEIRNQRQKVYGDDWKQQSDWELLALLKMKLKRLEHFVVERRDEQLYENRVDSLIDCVNYGLFMLQNELEKSKEKMVKKRVKEDVVKKEVEKVPAKRGRPRKDSKIEKLVEQEEEEFER